MQVASTMHKNCLILVLCIVLLQHCILGRYNLLLVYGITVLKGTAYVAGHKHMNLLPATEAKGD